MDELTRAGVESFNAGRLEEAAAHFRRALAGGAGPDARVFLAHALAAAGDGAGAAAEISAALAADARFLPAYEGLAGLVLRGAVPPAAVCALAPVLTLRPAAKLAAPLRLCARAWKAAGDLDSAESALRKAVRAAPRDRAARRELLDLHLAREQAYIAQASAAAEADAGERSLRRLLELAPEDRETRARYLAALRARAKSASAAGRLAEARSALRRALALEPGDSEARALLAELARAKGERAGGIETAERELRKGLALKPRDRELRRRLLELLRLRALEGLRSGRADSDARILARARAAGATEREARDHLAEILRQRALALSPERLPQVERSLRRVLALRPRDARARALLAEVLRRRGAAALAAGDLREAERRLLRAVEVSPRDPATRAALLEVLAMAARECRSAGKRAAAAALARRALRLSSGDPRALFIEGEVLFISGRRAGARRALAEALRRDRGALTPAERFKALVKLGDWRRALAQAGKILDDGPTLQDLRAFWDPWEWDERVSRAERETETLALAKAAGPRSPWTLYYRGALADGTALDDFRRLERRSARRWGWMMGKAATTALWNGEFELAAKWFERALAGGPVDWRARAFRAEALLCLHRVEEAYAEMERSLAEAPPSEAAQALAWLGAFDLWTGRYEAALPRLEEADRLGAMCAPCWKGGALLKLGRAEEALAVLDDALRRFPLDFEAYVWRGEAKRVLGRPEAALADLGAIHRSDAAPSAPSGLWALINRALCKRALGDAVGASEDFRALPADVVEYVRAKRGLAPGEETPILEAALDLARGFRREEYGQAIWMD